MEDRKVKMHQAEILKRAGYKQREIAEQLGVSDRMVRNYLNPKGRREATVRSSMLDPYREYITTVLEGTPHFNLEVLKRELAQRGYTGGMTILRVYAKTVRDSIIRKAVIRFETTPGLQAQVDWKEAGVWEIEGEARKVYAFVMLLGYSRRAYVRFTTDMKSATLLACHVEAFRYFGGIPREILYDNMKTAWLNRGGVWEANPALLEFASACGFMPKRCQVRRPQTKGKVERFIGYLGNHFLPLTRRKDIYGLDDLNGAVNTWLDGVDEERIRAFCESRNERFEREAPVLQPYVESAVPEIRETEVVVVSREGTIRFETNTYSVPARFLGAALRLKYHPLTRKAELWTGEGAIRSFELLQKGSRQSAIREEDRKELIGLWLRQTGRLREAQRGQERAGMPDAVDIRPPVWYERFFEKAAV